MACIHEGTLYLKGSNFDIQPLERNSNERRLLLVTSHYYQIYKIDIYSVPHYNKFPPVFDRMVN